MDSTSGAPQSPFSPSSLSPTHFGRRWLWIVASLVVFGGVMVAGWFIFAHHQPAPPSPHSAVTDTQKPQVVLTSPADQQTVSGILKLQVTATDNIGVQKVEYYVDGSFMGVSYAAPFNYDLDVTTLSAGTHQIHARAYDAAGNRADSQTVTVTVVNAAAATPSANSAPPAAGKTVAKAKTTSTITPTPFSPDITPPSQPTGLMLSADGIFLADLSWTASTDNVAVAGYKVFRDGTQIGTSTTASYVDNTVSPGATYHYKVQAYDTAGNLSTVSLEPGITMPPTSVWVNADTPDNTVTGGSAIELGARFTPSVNGQITGVRFYKAAGDSGAHTGNLWTTGGSNLATVTFSGESASGWQTASFNTPVAVTAGTTYIVSYCSPAGYYSYTSNYFTSAGITTSYLTAPATSGLTKNGLFTVAGSSSFPSSSFNDTNYWVDATFAPDPSVPGPSPVPADNSTVYATYPGSNTTGIPAGRRLLVRDRGFLHLRDGVNIRDVDLVGTTLEADANNVSVQYVRMTFPSGGLWGVRQGVGKTGLIAQDIDIHGNGTNQVQYGINNQGNTMTVRRANISVISDGIQTGGTTTVEDSFIHNLVFYAGDHNDDFLTTGGAGITLTHNTMLNSLAQTSAIGLFCDFNAVNNVTATGNLLAGGGYSIYWPNSTQPGCAGSGNIVFSNNQLSKIYFPTGGNFGPVANFTLADPGDAWTNNTWYEDDTPVVP